MSDVYPVGMELVGLKPDQAVGYVKGLGFSIFFGHVESILNIRVVWNRDGGDVKEFLKVAKSEGVRLIIMDWHRLSDNLIDEYLVNTDGITDAVERREASGRNDEVKTYKRYVGEVGTISVSWIKDGVKYLYIESTDWWTSFMYLIEESDREMEKR